MKSSNHPTKTRPRGPWHPNYASNLATSQQVPLCASQPNGVTPAEGPVDPCDNSVTLLQPLKLEQHQCDNTKQDGRTELPFGAQVSGTAPAARSLRNAEIATPSFLPAHASNMALRTCHQTWLRAYRQEGDKARCFLFSRIWQIKGRCRRFHDIIMQLQRKTPKVKYVFQEGVGHEFLISRKLMNPMAWVRTSPRSDDTATSIGVMLFLFVASTHDGAACAMRYAAMGCRKAAKCRAVSPLLSVMVASVSFLFKISTI